MGIYEFLSNKSRIAEVEEGQMYCGNSTIVNVFILRLKKTILNAILRSKYRESQTKIN